MMNKLREIREAHGMTQAELCEKTGLSRTTICKIENDRGANVNTHTIVKIAAAFGVPPSEIFLL